MNVHQAIMAVLTSLSEEGIGKNRKNAQQGFNFRGVDDIYQTLSPLLSQHGLYLAPDVGEIQSEARTTAKGTAMYSVRLTMHYTVTSAHDGSSIRVASVGEAMDTGDKATSKAMSMAFKYLCFQLFCIPLVGVPDADAETPEPTVRKKDAAKKGSAPAHDIEPFELLEEALWAIDHAKTIDDFNTVRLRISASGFKGDELAQIVAAGKVRRDELGA